MAVSTLICSADDELQGDLPADTQKERQEKLAKDLTAALMLGSLLQGDEPNKLIDKVLGKMGVHELNVSSC